MTDLLSMLESDDAPKVALTIAISDFIVSWSTERGLSSVHGTFLKYVQRYRRDSQTDTEKHSPTISSRRSRPIANCLEADETTDANLAHVCASIADSKFLRTSTRNRVRAACSFLLSVDTPVSPMLATTSVSGSMSGETFSVSVTKFSRRSFEFWDRVIQPSASSFSKTLPSGGLAMDSLFAKFVWLCSPSWYSR